MREEAVPEPDGVGPDAAVPSAREQQAEQILARVIGVSKDPIGLRPALMEDLYTILMMCQAVFIHCNASWLRAEYL